MILTISLIGGLLSGSLLPTDTWLKGHFKNDSIIYKLEDSELFPRTEYFPTGKRILYLPVNMDLGSSSMKSQRVFCSVFTVFTGAINSTTCFQSGFLKSPKELTVPTIHRMMPSPEV